MTGSIVEHTDPSITVKQALSISYGLYSVGGMRAIKYSMDEKILIIDDDEQIASAYKEYLIGLGYQVDCAQEVEEAETLLAHFTYSVVITDLRLSKLGFGGLNLIKHIRELSLKTRIIVVTGYGWPELKAEASAHQVDAFVKKPTRLSELAKTIGSLAGGA